MKNLLISLSLVLVLTAFGTFVFMDTAGAQNNLMEDLLNLPAPPPPNPLMAYRRSRDENFYSKKKPPADDAPIDELIDYWQTQSTNYQDPGYNIAPSEETLDRLFKAVEEKPHLLGSLINIIPETPEAADFVKKMYEAARDGESEEADTHYEGITDWLKYHSNYYGDQLLEEARQVRDEDEYVTNQNELLALSRVNFSRAQTIINRLYNDPTQPVSQTLARWALYRRAIDTDSLGDIEKYRDELKATVENKQASPGMRDLALDALLAEKEWSGREDWYMGLLEDETLADLKVNGRTYTGLTTIMYFAPPEKYMDKMLALLKSSNPAVRNAAVKNLVLLISKDSPEVVRALLPWLENRKWATESGGERARLIEALQTLMMPESVPGLIEVMEESRPIRLAANTNANISSPDMDGEDASPPIYRHMVITALGAQKDPRAVPALRRILYIVDEYERAATVKALLQTHGFSVPEQVDALESVAKKSAETEANPFDTNFTNSNAKYRASTVYTTNANTYVGGEGYTSTINSNVYRPYVPRPLNADDLKILLGTQLIENPEAEESLVNGVLDRINLLERKDPPTAVKLRYILQRWNGPAVNAMMLRDLKNGKANLDSIVKLLSLRKELMENQATAVYEVRDGSPLAFGIAACILDSNSDYDAILNGENVESKTAMLACARLVRADLPVKKTAEHLGSGNKMLALAAERYLESNDSPEARAAVLALHPDEARIMGATTHMAPGDATLTESEFLQQLFRSVAGFAMDGSYLSNNTHDIENTEERLQKEVREDTQMLGVYFYNNNFVRIYKDKAVFSWEEDTARYHERDLSAGEFDNFKDFLASNRVDTLPPFLSDYYEEEETVTEELLMLGRPGGRRVFMRAGSRPQFFKDLNKAFEEMRKPPAKLRYWLEKDLPGLEILFADDNLKATAVWKNGADTRVLIENVKQQAEIEKELDNQYQEEGSGEDVDYEKVEIENRKRRQQRQFEHLSWRSFSSGGISALVSQPAGFEVIPVRDGHAVPPSGFPWRTRSGGVELRTNTEGLYRVSQGQLTKIRSGYYNEPLIVPGARWAVATTLSRGMQLVRVNLLTGKEFPVEIQSPYTSAVAFIPSVKRVVVAAGGYGGSPGTTRVDWYFLDPETGAIQPARGEFLPLGQQTVRPLQPAAAPDEFWAAIPDTDKNETQIGIYNSRNFTFKPLQKVSRISFSSMEMWVDEKENKIYLAYAGHLLAFPLKK